MESFVLAETFKYLYMIFSEPSDLIFDPDNYVLTTEAHFLPLTIGENSDTAANLVDILLTGSLSYLYQSYKISYIFFIFLSI